MKTDLSGVIIPLVTDGLFIRKDEYYKKYLYSDILWIEASGSYSYFYLKGKPRIAVSCRLGSVERQLRDDLLVRVHRGFILNLCYVDMYTGNSLSIGKKWFSIGENYRKSVLVCFTILDTSRGKGEGENNRII